MRLLLTMVLLGAAAGWSLPSHAQQTNACGCYRADDGTCRCTKVRKPKCVCEGDCEPVGCEAEHQKKANKEADAALKRINAKEKKKSAQAIRDQKKPKKQKASATTQDTSGQ